MEKEKLRNEIVSKAIEYINAANLELNALAEKGRGVFLKLEPVDLTFERIFITEEIFNKIKSIVERQYNLDDLTKRTRFTPYVRARRVFDKIIYENSLNTEYSLKRLAKVTGQRDHSTIIHSKTKFFEEYEIYEDVFTSANKILATLKSQNLISQGYVFEKHEKIKPKTKKQI